MLSKEQRQILADEVKKHINNYIDMLTIPYNYNESTKVAANLSNLIHLITNLMKSEGIEVYGPCSVFHYVDLDFITDFLEKLPDEIEEIPF